MPARKPDGSKEEAVSPSSTPGSFYTTSTDEGSPERSTPSLLAEGAAPVAPSTFAATLKSSKLEHPVQLTQKIVSL